jgi:hypothetical protein
VSADPAVIEVGDYATGRIVESIDGAAVVVEIAIGAIQAAFCRNGASKAVDTFVIGAGTGSVAAVIRTAGSVGERSEIIVERMVFLHDDDDVIDFVQATVGKYEAGGEQAESERD